MARNVKRNRADRIATGKSKPTSWDSLLSEWDALELALT